MDYCLIVEQNRMESPLPMKALNITGVYKISSPSGSFYIGSSTNVRKRWLGHRSELRRGVHHCTPLQRAADKYGVDSLVISVITACPQGVLRDVEQLAMDHCKPEYNSSSSTYEALTQLWKDPEFRAKGIARSREWVAKLRLNPAYVENQRKASSITLAKLHSDPEFAAAHAVRATDRLKRLVIGNPEALAKASDGRRRFYENNPEAAQARKDQARAAMLEIHSDPGMRAKLDEGARARMTAMRSDPAAREKNLAGVRAAKSKAVLCVETGQVFSSITDAVIWLGLTSRQSAHLGAVLKRSNKCAYGYTWARVSKDSGSGIQSKASSS